jgi:transposase
MIYCGIDWARHKHNFHLIDESGQKIDAGVFEHSADSINEFIRSLIHRAGAPNAVPVGIESHRGVLVPWLIAAGIKVYSIPTQTASAARKLYDPSGSKNDGLDASVIADFVRINHSRLTPDQPQDDRIVEIKGLLDLRETLVKQKTALLQSLRETLDQYWPALSKIAPSLDANWALKLLDIVPTPRSLKTINGKRLNTVLRDFRTDASDKIRALRTEAVIPVSVGVERVCALNVVALIRQIRAVEPSLATIEEKLETLVESDPDIESWRSLPRSGLMSIAGLIALFGSLPDSDWRRRAARCGASPITVQSGKMTSVRRRQAYDRTLGQCALYYARSLILGGEQTGGWTYRRYSEYRSAGMSYGGALRRLSRTWIKIISAMLRDGTRYDESRFIGQRSVAG